MRENVKLSEMTIKSEKTREMLRVYLGRISGYKNFDQQMKVRVYMDAEKDFTAFEAVNYNLLFTSTAHKLLDTIKSPFFGQVVAFSEFVAIVDRIAANAA